MFWLKYLVSLINKIRFERNETHYSELSTDEIYILLQALSYKITLEKDLRQSDLTEVGGIKIKFIGIVKPLFFCLSRKEIHPQSFLPRVKCNLSQEKELTQLDLCYQLFPSTRFWFLLFTSVCLGASVISYIKDHNIYSYGIPLLIILGSYLIAKANFAIHCKTFRKTLFEEI